VTSATESLGKGGLNYIDEKSSLWNSRWLKKTTIIPNNKTSQTWEFRVLDAFLEKLILLLRRTKFTAKIFHGNPPSSSSPVAR
jgi:hypothetical protein